MFCSMPWIWPRVARKGKIVLEGEAVTLVPVMAAPDHFLHGLYAKAKAQGLILGACKACSAKLKVTEAVTAENSPDR